MSEIKSNINDKNTTPYKSEFTRKQKRGFLYSLLIMLLSFIILWSIGEDINDNPYMFRAFLAPFLLILSIVLMTLNFCIKR